MKKMRELKPEIRDKIICLMKNKVLGYLKSL